MRRAETGDPGPHISAMRGSGRALRLGLILVVVLTGFMLAFSISWVRENGEDPFDWEGVPAFMAIAAGVAVGSLGFILIPVRADEKRHRTRLQIVVFELLLPATVALGVAAATSWWATFGARTPQGDGIWPGAGLQRTADLVLMLVAVTALARVAGLVIENARRPLHSLVGTVLGLLALAAGPLGLLWSLGTGVSATLSVVLVMATGVMWLALAGAALLIVPAAGTFAVQAAPPEVGLDDGRGSEGGSARPSSF